LFEISLDFGSHISYNVGILNLIRKGKNEMAQKTEIYELTPNNGRKSFYGKANVIVIGGRRYLRSYDTIIGCVDENGVMHRYSDYHSHTTGCHVKSFFADSNAFWKLPLEKCPKVTVTL